MFFETFNVPAMFIALQGALSLFATAKTTGIVLESGDGVTQVLPIYDGYSISHANNRINLGGRDVTDHLNLLLRRAGYHFNSSSEYEVIKRFK